MFCLATDLLVPEEYLALGLVCRHPRRWGCETVIRHHKTDMGEGQPMLHSDPEGIMQEIWALFAVYTGDLQDRRHCRERGGHPPDMISFPHALAVATNTVAAFPPGRLQDR